MPVVEVERGIDLLYLLTATSVKEMILNKHMSLNIPVKLKIATSKFLW